MPPLAPTNKPRRLPPEQMRRHSSCRDLECGGYLCRPCTRVLAHIRGDIVLGDLARRALPQQRRPRSTQPFALTQQLLMRSQLLIQTLQAIVDLSHHAPRRLPHTATRTISHHKPPSTRTPRTTPTLPHVTSYYHVTSSYLRAFGITQRLAPTVSRPTPSSHRKLPSPRPSASSLLFLLLFVLFFFLNLHPPSPSNLPTPTLPAPLHLPSQVIDHHHFSEAERGVVNDRPTTPRNPRGQAEWL